VQAVAEVMDLEHKGLVDLEGEEQQLVAAQQHLELLIQEVVEVAPAAHRPVGVDLEL
jgi:hypothetical protein